MAARTWLIRSLFLACIACIVGGGVWAQAWIRHSTVRQQLVDGLNQKLQNVDIDVDSAHLRLLGGISISNLKLTRRDDPNHTPFVEIPFAVVQHDKEQLSKGELVIRKVEMERPIFRIEKRADGRWNFLDLLNTTAGTKEDCQAPMFILKKARLEFYDRQRNDHPLIVIQDAELSLINDPCPVLNFQLRGLSPSLGTISLKGRFEKGEGASGSIELNQVTVDTSLIQWIEGFLPEAAEHLETLRGNASLQVDWSWKPNREPALFFAWNAEFSQGKWAHPALPHPLHDMHIKAHGKGEEWVLEKATAKADGMDIAIGLEMAPGKALQNVALEDRFKKVEVSVKGLQVTADLMKRLPGSMSCIQPMFSPAGAADLTVVLKKKGDKTHKHIAIRPHGMSGSYSGFAYPLKKIHGTIDFRCADGEPDQIDIDIQAEANGRPVTIKGICSGGLPQFDVDLAITGKGIILDQALINALPVPYPRFISSLRITTTGDFTAKIRHNAQIRADHGPDVFDNEFDIHLTDGSLNYEEFPYPLKGIKGHLLIHTVPSKPSKIFMGPGVPLQPAPGEIGSAEFRDFQAFTPTGGKLLIQGSKVPVAQGCLLDLNIQGEGVALDNDLYRALAKLKLDSSWSTFDPQGIMNCTVQVKIMDRSIPGKVERPFKPAEDLEMGFSFAGPSIRPTFLPLRLDDFSGRLSYSRGEVRLSDLQARYGSSQITLSKSAEKSGDVYDSVSRVLLPPTGGFWADLRGLTINPLIVDNSFRNALPPGLRKGWEALELKGGMALVIPRMVIDDRQENASSVAKQASGPQNTPVNRVYGNAVVPAADYAPKPNTSTIYWDAQLFLQNASLKTGILWEDVTGRVASKGLYIGEQFGRVSTDVVFDRGLIFKQPIEGFSAHLDIDPNAPNIVQVPRIKARIYGGDLGGRAEMNLKEPFRFDLDLHLARVRLEEIARRYNLGGKSKLEGLANGKIMLTNRIDEKTGFPILQGTGGIDVTEGKMLDLPPLLDLIKIARLRPMDQTGFESAQILFRIRGDRLKFGQIDLLGNAVSLGGEGEMNLDGSDVHLEFYTIWTNLRNLMGNSGEIPAKLSGSLFKIRVTGNIDDKLKYAQEPVPFIVEPIRRVMGRMR